MHSAVKRGATRSVTRGELRECTNGEMALTLASMMTLRTVAGTLVWQIPRHDEGGESLCFKFSQRSVAISLCLALLGNTLGS